MSHSCKNEVFLNDLYSIPHISDYTDYIYIKSPITSRSDTIWSLYIATSIIQEGNTDLDEYAHLISPDDYRIEQIGSHIYSIFPIGAPLISTPFIFLIKSLPSLTKGMPISIYLTQHKPDQVIFDVEKGIASVIVAITAVFLFITALRSTSTNRSVVLILIFALATSAWSTASRGLWQHGPTMLTTSITLYLITLVSEKPYLGQFVAIPLAFGYIIRPTNFILILALSIYIYLVVRRYFSRYVFWLTLIILPFLLYNYSIYHSILSPYYMPQRLVGNSLFLEALTGNLISPSRGLFIFSPVLYFSIYGIALKIQHGDWQLIDAYLVAIMILHWIAISLFRHWHGGWSIGPRFFTDVIPIFIYFLIPVIHRVPQLKEQWGIKSYIFLALLCASCFIQFRCATSQAPTSWNFEPNNIDQNLNRLWDWSDIQFLRGLCSQPFYQAPKCWLQDELSPSDKFRQIERAEVAAGYEGESAEGVLYVSEPSSTQ